MNAWHIRMKYWFIRTHKVTATDIYIFTGTPIYNPYPKYCNGNLGPLTNNVHKKNSKNLLKNYRPISLLPICGKIFEKCIYNSIYSYFEDNNLFSPYQSGFRKQDSYVPQLLVIAHEIFTNFNASPSLERRAVFLDIS